jgi:crotonobetainyl-CoA:carnitine CoA-transferase CaiB-like acyl-CoA transferase
MAHPEGQALIKQWPSSDILVENFKVGGLKQYGLDYASLKQANPRLIYCSVTGFGQDGPYAERAGYDLMIQAMSGMMSITGHADDQPGGGPMRMGVALIDILTGIYATSAILAPSSRAIKLALVSTSTWRCSMLAWRCWPTRRPVF